MNQLLSFTVHPFADVVASQTLSTMNRSLSTLANLRHNPIRIEPFPIHILSFCYGFRYSHHTYSSFLIDYSKM